jgi:hypothetical protein
LLLNTKIHEHKQLHPATYGYKLYDHKLSYMLKKSNNYLKLSNEEWLASQ